MKPDLVTCNNCGKPIPKGKWCSDKCRKAFSRNPDNKADKPYPDKDKSQLGQNSDKEAFRASLTPTDRTFYDRALRDFPKEQQPYYKFGSETHESKCRQCDKKFRTSLSLLNYCSYDHYKTALSAR